MQPEQGKPPAFSQIYIYDQEHELDNCMKPFSGLDASLLLDLQEMIKSVNPYAHTYLHASEALTANPACDIKLVLKSPSKQVDPHRYNFPTGTDVAVIMSAETLEAPCKRDVVVYKSAEDHPSGQVLMKIDTIHPMYGPLTYVLMFP